MTGEVFIIVGEFCIVVVEVFIIGEVYIIDEVYIVVVEIYTETLCVQF